MWMITLLMVALLAHVTQGVFRYDTGKGLVYGLSVVQDVTIERPYSNHYGLPFLLVSRHPGYPNKRSLVQFENLPRSCPADKVVSAKMYLYYVYAHKPSWHPITRTPFVPRYMQVHLVKKSWNEHQATSSKRSSSTYWSKQYLGLDNTDAEANPQDVNPVDIFPYRPRGIVEFDVTKAIIAWQKGVPNYGLVIRAINELEIGRGIRFASSADHDRSRHPYVLVLCKQ
ncbi:unnamed protein product [Pocillopora meandrina]|uniref:Uncharacterized protein n=1 Tax=Pocillopora meandrina TaxID=46732 RepID=A0AAU9WNT6_9CNID|nr:unnamed protein product [Pocillopora meandrina]